MDRLELHDLEPARDCGELEHHGITDASSNQSLSDWGRHADVPLLELHRISEDQAIALALTGLLGFRQLRLARLLADDEAGAGGGRPPAPQGCSILGSALSSRPIQPFSFKYQR